jgi:hypothetical protein
MNGRTPFVSEWRIVGVHCPNHPPVVSGACEVAAIQRQLFSLLIYSPHCLKPAEQTIWLHSYSGHAQQAEGMFGPLTKVFPERYRLRGTFGTVAALLAFGTVTGYTKWNSRDGGS